MSADSNGGKKWVNLTPIFLAYDRLFPKPERVCICPSHASNRGECPIHDEKGRVRGRF